MPQITMTTSNGRNGVTPGRSRVTVRTTWEQIVGAFEVPSRQPRMYLKKHTRGEYARKLRQLEALARQLERDHNKGGQLPLLVA